jgi:hypothetical protein
MINLDIARQRLHNQLITRSTFEKPEHVVKWLGAVQAQILWLCDLNRRYKDAILGFLTGMMFLLNGVLAVTGMFHP